MCLAAWLAGRLAPGHCAERQKARRREQRYADAALSHQRVMAADAL